MNLESRKFVFILLFLTVGIVFTIRLFYMQVVDDRWIERAGEVAKVKIRIKPPRGIMYDRNGEKVVSNKTYYNLMFIENDIKKLDTLALSKLIDISVDSIRQRFEEIRRNLDRRTRSKFSGKDTLVNDYRSYLPYPLLKELTANEVAKIAVKIPSFEGFYIKPISLRYYNYSVGGNIFGYLSQVNARELRADPDFYQMGDLVGRTGLERYYEKILRGQKGTKILLRSAKGKILDDYAGGKLDTNAEQSPPLHLGLDVHLQAYGERLMKNKIGAVVAIEPSTGDILAMVSAPTFNPNSLVGTRKFNKNYVRLYHDSLQPFFPRAIAAAYPPGSTFKVLEALIGLQEGVVTPHSSFPCDKSWVGCHHHPQSRSIAEGIKVSCNPYFYAVTKRIIRQNKASSIFKDAAIGLKVWDKYMHSFGLGEKLNTDIFGIEGGLIPNVQFYNRWYGEYRWAFSTIQSNSIGQGEVKLTVLQLANVAAIVANKGWYYTPHFVKSIGNNGPLARFNEKQYTMVDSSHFAIVQKGMQMAVNVAGGTAWRGRLNKVGITVCGKTGTAQNPHGKDHSVFIAFAPYHNPKIAIAVLIENGGYGDSWAAPISSLMIEKYLTGKIEYKWREKRVLQKRFVNKKDEKQKQ